MDKCHTSKGDMRVGQRQEDKILSLLALPLMMNVWGKESRRLEKGSEEQEEDMIIWILRIKCFPSPPFFEQYWDY